MCLVTRIAHADLRLHATDTVEHECLMVVVPTTCVQAKCTVSAYKLLSVLQPSFLIETCQMLLFWLQMSAPLIALVGLRCSCCSLGSDHSSGAVSILDMACYCLVKSCNNFLVPTANALPSCISESVPFGVILVGVLLLASRFSENAWHPPSSQSPQLNFM